MSDALTPRQRFLSELRRLYEAAGLPKHDALVRQGNAQRPPVVLNDATLSDWFGGKSVPTNSKAVRFLVEFLQSKAQGTGYQQRPLGWWLDLHQQAREYQLANRRGRPSQRMNAGRVEYPLSGGGSLMGGVGVVVPRQLPAVPADFTGRRRELDELVARCTDGKGGACSPLVISGLAGVGKSALAVRLAHELASRYPEGQLYSAMRGPGGRPLGSEVTLARFLRALGMAASEVPTELAEQAAQYRSMLAGKRVLVVLDDASDEEQVGPLLPGNSPCLVVVTSRNPLPALASAVTYPLGLLDPAEGLELLAVIGGADRAAADPDASRRIVDLCGWLPLALRIAAARLRSRIDWTSEDLAARLSDARRPLREFRVGNLDVRASFELSYRDLSADTARLFRRLAAVPGTTFSGELAAELIGTAQPDTDELIDRLVLDQLVEALGKDRYRMHPLVRLLAAELFGKDQDGEVTPTVNAMFLWYADKVMTSVPLPGQRLEARPAASDWLDAEESNLLALLELSEQAGADGNTAALAVPIAAVTQSRAMWSEWKRAIDLGLAGADRFGDPTLQAVLLAELGDYQLRKAGDRHAALTSLSEALRLIDPDEVPSLACRVHQRLAVLHWWSGQHDKAEDELAAAAAAAAVSSDDPDMAAAIVKITRADMLMEQKNFSEASELLAMTASLWTKQDVLVEVGRRVQLAEAYIEMRRYSAALAELERSRELCRDYAVRAHAPNVQLMLGKVNRALGDMRKARQAWQEGLALVDSAPGTYSAGLTARLAYELADTYAKDGNHAIADKQFDRAAQSFEQADQYLNRAGALDRQAQQKMATADPAGAISAWEAAIAGLDHATDPQQAEENRQFLHTKLRRITSTEQPPGDT